jgi:putative hydrolase of the HAD superfamily
MAGDRRGLLLDLDGTLVDRDAALRTWLRRRAGLGGEAIAELLALDAADRCSLVGLGLAVDRIRPGLARDPRALTERIRAELPGLIVGDPAVARALGRLREAGLRLALVSNGGGLTQRRKLAAAGLSERLFDAIVISGERGYAKPSAAMFEAALAELEVEAEAATMIGDSPEQDIAGAAGVGVATIWIGGGRVYPAHVLAPDRVAGDFLGVVALLLG